MTKINNEFPTTSYNNILSKHYFLKVAKEIIEISNLENEKTILDYGCGEKIFSKLLSKPRIFNYDIKPEYNEVQSVKNCFKSDVIIFNHVWMYISQNEIERILSDIKEMNKNAKIILSMGKQNLISKILMILAGKPKSHDNIISTYNEQLQIFNKFCKISKTKKNIYYMTDIYLGEFLYFFFFK